MFRLLALAAHFSPFNPGPFDPAVVSLLNTYFESERTPDNVVDIGGVHHDTTEETPLARDPKAA